MAVESEYLHIKTVIRTSNSNLPRLTSEPARKYSIFFRAPPTRILDNIHLWWSCGTASAHYYTPRVIKNSSTTYSYQFLHDMGLHFDVLYHSVRVKILNRNLETEDFCSCRSLHGPVANASNTLCSAQAALINGTPPMQALLYEIVLSPRF